MWKRTRDQLLIFLLISGVTIFSVSLAFCVTLCISYLIFFRNKKNISQIIVFVATLLMDIYSLDFIGISFLKVVIFFLIAKQFKTTTLIRN